MAYKDGKEYSGNFIKDKSNGKGKYITPNKETYEGEFKNGIKERKEILIKRGIGTFSGNPVKDHSEGRGKLLGEDKSVHEGEFFKGAIQGKGKKSME